MKCDLEHIAVCCRDPEALLVWYASRFEMARIVIDGKKSGFLKAPGGGLIEFLPAEAGAPATARESAAGLRHIAFSTDDLDRLMRRLADAKPVKPPFSTDSGTRMAFYYDPEGNIVQLVQRLLPLG